MSVTGNQTQRMNARCLFQRFGIALAGVGLVSGCMSDPPPDPEVQPLEIIVGDPDSEYGPCLLNVDEVGAGTHDVTPMAMAGRARVRILDPSGAVVFNRTIEEHPAEGGGHEVMQDEQGTVRLQPGEHRVECILAEGTHSTSLRVVPARPGYQG
jgi:hypothetical protein